MKSKMFTPALFLIVSLLFSVIPTAGFAVVSINQNVNETTDCSSTLFAPLQISDLPDMSRKEIEQRTNRSLTIRERLTLKLLKRHAKRMNKLGISAGDDCSKLEKKATNSILFGVLGLLIAGLIFGIIAISAGSKAVKLANANPDCPDADKKRKKGRIGIVLGVLDIIGAVIVLALVL